ncbi:MAG: Fic family protein [Armatimonadota bacterium]
MERKLQGYYLPSSASGETYRSYIPDDLPPTPPLVFDKEMNDLLEQANRSLGRLDGSAMFLPDIALFLYFYVRKEAVLSSQIEGTQSSLSDLLLFEIDQIPGVPIDDVQEVSNYVAALVAGLKALNDGTALTMRLIKEIHSVLLAKGRGCDKNPGEFRRSQNWIAGTRPGNALYVPPPYAEVDRLMGQLELFINDMPERTPTLVKAALAHVQFETIHAFLDGNGRLGRLLITLILCNDKALNNPMLYLSLYFKANRQQYYTLLQDVRVSGDWEKWLKFFLVGVRETSNQAASTIKRILDLFTIEEDKIEALGSSVNSLLRVHHAIRRNPIITIATIVKEVNISKPTAAAAVAKLEDIGILKQVSSKRRERIYVYKTYLDILDEGTEPIN